MHNRKVNETSEHGARATWRGITSTSPRVLDGSKRGAVPEAVPGDAKNVEGND